MPAKKTKVAKKELSRSDLCLYALIDEVQDMFKTNLSKELGLKSICSPLFFLENSGFNDELNYVEKPISFTTATNQDCVIVHSLSKWKRFTLGRLQNESKKIQGIVTKMDAIRRDESPIDILNSKIHSFYVDQWDWELIMDKKDRTIEFLKSIVTKIYSQILKTKKNLDKKYPKVFGKNKVAKEVFFIDSQDLEDMYPKMTPKERENAITKEHGSVFIMRIGGVLKSGEKHDGRAPDYDDWELNGDLFIYNDVLGKAVELSSMGIRVDEEAMKKQLKLLGKEEKAKLPFHSALLAGKLPQTIGGGIGRSRVTMFLLEAKHIGEVQCSVWPEEITENKEYEIL